LYPAGHELLVPGVELLAAVAGQGFELEVQELEDVQGSRLVLVEEGLVAGFVDFLVEYATGNQVLGPLEVRVTGKEGVVQVEEYEFHLDRFKGSGRAAEFPAAGAG
jgi:hypothetical protein